VHVVLSMQQLVFASLPCAYNPLLTWVAYASQLPKRISAPECLATHTRLLLLVEHVTMLLWRIIQVVAASFRCAA